VITGWISALFPYAKNERTGLATNRNPWLTLKSQRIEDVDIDDEIDEIDIDDEIEDIDIDAEDVEWPPAARPLNRLILKRKQDMEDSLGTDPDRRFASRTSPLRGSHGFRLKDHNSIGPTDRHAPALARVAARQKFAGYARLFYDVTAGLGALQGRGDLAGCADVGDDVVASDDL
jgi:hypothetical protein